MMFFNERCAFFSDKFRLSDLPIRVLQLKKFCEFYNDNINNRNTANKYK